MEHNSYDSLTQAEREDLALCGITSEDQLAKNTATQLRRDLAQAKKFFPERSFALTDTRIKALFPEQLSEPDSEKTQYETEGRSAESIANFKRRSQGLTAAEIKKRNKNNMIMHSPVRCTHRLTAILAAFCTLFLLIPLGSVAVFPILMLTDNMPNMPVWLLAVIVLGIPCAVYMFVAHRATCPVCHIRIFRFTHYTRNRAAHHIPFLGYNFATALHILFFWQYNCPGCGTPVKFLSSKGRRTHS